MPNPDLIVGYDEKEPDTFAVIFTIIYVLMMIIAVMGVLLGWWKGGSACPYYDSGGELHDDCQ